MSATDRTDDKPDKGKTLPESLPGAQHPLAMPSTDSLKSSAVEIVQGPGLADPRKADRKVARCDHTIQFKDGRQFLVHIPPTESKKTAASYVRLLGLWRTAMEHQRFRS